MEIRHVAYREYRRILRTLHESGSRKENQQKKNSFLQDKLAFMVRACVKCSVA